MNKLDFFKILERKKIDYTVSSDSTVIIVGSLYLSGTSITALPESFSCDSLYLDPGKISNVTHRNNCGYSSRTIFAVWTDNTFKIAAGCFFDTPDAFEEAVDKKYDGEAAEEYKQAGRDCVNDLAKKMANNS